ncbi:cellulose synthase (UDP-forming) [Streptococcus henryi]|uniref:Cellulose synthase (UDP-forming) n=1 Tax=Streptococcus henryi TaxID=439219 RepID=A0A1G6D5I2_9STRE|nr:glycosyltransferase [Streptococcus henryi]SDB40319.1 cellulose synthase (UDP-forming) [Streptococcus henryi]
MTIRQRLLYALAFLTTVFYLSWRIISTIPWRGSLFAIIFALLLWFSEVTSSITAYIIIWNKQKNLKLEKPIIRDNQYPDIDVFIATHNEDTDLLYKTINACTYMAYPDKSKVHIYICDDTNRSEVAKLAQDFGVGYFGLSDNKHAKSGNLNNGLNQTSSPLVATFDADMIPYRDFLLETVPYFIEQLEADEKDEELDTRIGLIQTPQSFYNTDIFQFNLFSEDTLPNEQDFFSKGVNVLNNARGAAVYTGSNTVLYRKAIEDAGGFPINTITEDFELGVRMNTKGYVNYSTTEPMASGLTPTDLRSVLKQRIRWGRGVLNSSYNMNIFFNPKLTLVQRIIYINGYLYWWSFFRRLLYILAPILFTVFHVRVVVANVWLLLFFWLPSYVLTRLSMSDVTNQYRTQAWGEIVETILAPYLVAPLFLEAFGIREKKFKVTKKSGDSSRWEWLYALPYLVLWGLSVYGLLTFNYGKFGSELFYGSVISFWLIHHIINLTFAIFCSLGRPLYRASERFAVDDYIMMESWSEKFEVHLSDISETGVSFFTEEPIYLPRESWLTLYLKSRDYQAKVKAEVVRVYPGNNGWNYGLRFVEIPDQEKREFLQYIYDRVNHNLPQIHDNWMSILDDLFENISRRLNKPDLKETVYNKDALPVIMVNEVIDVEGRERNLVQTNYAYMTLSDRPTEEEKLGRSTFIDHKGLKFQLEFLDFDFEKEESIYRVKNLAELQAYPEFNQLAQEWRGRV